MIRIENIEDTITRLQQLQADTIPQFGSMTPQQMVEHITVTIKGSNGKINIPLRFTEDEAAVWKKKMIYTDMDFPMGLKSPLVADGPPVYVHADLPAAVEALRAELTDFEAHHQQNPEIKHTHPRLGELNHKEWLIFHSKHFTHHFKQFGLI